MMIRRFHEGAFGERNSNLPMTFIHINKTAGTSLGALLFSQFEESEIAPPFRGDFSKIKIGDPAIRLYHGHITYANWYHNGVDALLVCMLRDPKQRVVSQYKSFKSLANSKDAARWTRDPKGGAEALEIARTSSFDQFLLSDHPHIIEHLNNYQVRFLSTSGEARDETDVEEAVKNLGRFFFFGITERFDESIDLLRFQWLDRTLPELKELNVSGQETIKATSAKAKKALEYYTRLDRALYPKAVELFEERVRAAQAVPHPS